MPLNGHYYFKERIIELIRISSLVIKKIKLKNPIIFAGFVGAGLVGPVAINHIIEKLEFLMFAGKSNWLISTWVLSIKIEAGFILRYLDDDAIAPLCNEWHTALAENSKLLNVDSEKENWIINNIINK